MSYEFAKKEIGDYRITIYQDEDAECPCTEWDLAGVYFWDYSDYGYNRELSRGCSSEVDAENAEAALKELESKAELYDEQGWRMLGVLKQLIKESGIDIQGKMDEWKKDSDEKDSDEKK